MLDLTVVEIWIEVEVELKYIAVFVENEKDEVKVLILWSVVDSEDTELLVLDAASAGTNVAGDNKLLIFFSIQTPK